jgi:hypothetical protein
MPNYPQLYRFENQLMNELARLWREGERRIERTRVEEIGRRFDVPAEEAGELFLRSRGTLWDGELTEEGGEESWRAAELDDVYSTGYSPGEDSL